MPPAIRIRVKRAIIELWMTKISQRYHEAAGNVQGQSDEDFSLCQDPPYRTYCCVEEREWTSQDVVSCHPGPHTTLLEKN
jgi:hypothetical protein